MSFKRCIPALLAVAALYVGMEAPEAAGPRAREDDALVDMPSFVDALLAFAETFDETLAWHGDTFVQERTAAAMMPMRSPDEEQVYRTTKMSFSRMRTTLDFVKGEMVPAMADEPETFIDVLGYRFPKPKENLQTHFTLRTGEGAGEVRVGDEIKMTISTQQAPNTFQYDSIVSVVSVDGDLVTVTPTEDLDLGSFVDESKVFADWRHEYQTRKLATDGVLFKDDGVPDALREELLSGVALVRESEEIDYHPHTREVVRDLVHPSLYPYIKGVTRVTNVPPQVEPCENEHDFWERPYEDSKYQWLPAIFKVSAEGSVEIETDISYLSRSKYPSLYTSLASLFVEFMPMLEKTYQYIQENSVHPGGEPESFEARGLFFNLARNPERFKREFMSEPANTYGSSYGGDSTTDFRDCPPMDPAIIRQHLQEMRSHFQSAPAPNAKMQILAGIESELEDFEAKVACKDGAKLKDRDLQVITKIVDYELREGSADFDGVWHVEGMSHENIIATGLYILDRDDDVEGGDLLFQRPWWDIEAGIMHLSIPQARHPIYERMVHNSLLPLGRLPTPRGRMIAFPNSHVHRVTAMTRALESSKPESPARRTIIAFFLVNPDVYIVSTREVESPQTTMSLEDAKAHRLELMKERKYTKQDFNQRAIELCEH